METRTNRNKEQEGETMSFPKITIEGKDYWQVACRKCSRADRYKIYFDGSKGLVFQCDCGNITEWAKAQLQSKPDEKPIPLHQLT
jgi:hypothetical protein